MRDREKDLPRHTPGTKRALPRPGVILLAYESIKALTVAMPDLGHGLSVPDDGLARHPAGLMLHRMQTSARAHGILQAEVAVAECGESNRG